MCLHLDSPKLMDWGAKPIRLPPLYLPSAETQEAFLATSHLALDARHSTLPPAAVQLADSLSWTAPDVGSNDCCPTGEQRELDSSRRVTRLVVELLLAGAERDNYVKFFDQVAIDA